jgi:hypothetical protein
MLRFTLVENARLNYLDFALLHGRMLEWRN